MSDKRCSHCRQHELVGRLRDAIAEHRVRRRALRPIAAPILPETGLALPSLVAPEIAAAHRRADERLWATIEQGDEQADPGARP